jgi:hypothetical protein
MKRTLKLIIPLEEPHHSEPPYLKISTMIHSTLSRNIICIIAAVDTISDNLSIVSYNGN